MFREIHRFRPLFLIALLSSFAAVVVAPGAITAQEPVAPSPSDVEAAEAAAAVRLELLGELDDRFEILDLRRGGYILEPLDESAAFRSLEVAADGVWIDGDPIAEESLRRFVEDDAARIFELSRSLGAAGPPADRPRVEAPPSSSPSSPAAPVAPLPDEDLVERELEEIDERLERRLEEIERRAERALEDAEQRRREFEREAELERERLRDRLESTEDLGERTRQRTRTSDRVVLLSGLTVDEDESAEGVTVIRGSANIEGVVEGDAVVVLGTMRVSGRVEGDAVVVGGDLSLEGDAVIEGDVAVVGGELYRDEGSRILGEISTVDTVGFDWDDIEWGSGHRRGWDDDSWIDFSWSNLFFSLFELLFVAFLIVCTLFLGPEAARRTGARARLEPWKAGLVGLVAEVTFIVVVVLLTISCIGIPLVFLLVIATVIVGLLGLAGVLVELGLWLRRRFNMAPGSLTASAMLGLVLVYGWTLLGDLLSWIPWPFKLLIVLTMIFGALAKYAAWTVGLGAVLLDQFSPLPAHGAGLLPPSSPLPPPVPPVAPGEFGAEPEPWTMDEPTPTAEADGWPQDDPEVFVEDPEPLVETPAEPAEAPLEAVEPVEEPVEPVEEPVDGEDDPPRDDPPSDRR